MKAGYTWLLTAMTSVLEPHNLKLMRWQGRHLNREDGSSAFDWPGTQFTVSIENGSYLRAAINATVVGTEPVRLQVFLADGGTDAVIWKQGGAYRPSLQWEVPLVPSHYAYVLASGLPERATVTVLVGHSPDTWSGSLSLINLSTDGVFVEPKLPRTYFERRIEFIGDSITSGSQMRRAEAQPAIGLDGDPECAHAALHSDFGHSYASMLCQAFGASCSTMAINGKGLVANCCDTGPNMPEIYKRHLYHEVNVTYPFQYAPHAVVINLGTNDYNGCKLLRPGEDPCGSAFDQEFASKYLDFMVDITRWYNTTAMHFFLVVGPITAKHLNATLTVVNNALLLGLDATLLNLQACIEECKGCHSHPNVKDHERMFKMAYWPMKMNMNW